MKFLKSLGTKNVVTLIYRDDGPNYTNIIWTTITLLNNFQFNNVFLKSIVGLKVTFT